MKTTSTIPKNGHRPITIALFISTMPNTGHGSTRTSCLNGSRIELMTQQLIPQSAPEYRTELQHVWLLREVSPDVCRRINLPSRDEGVDLIARTRRGEYWAI